MTTMPEDAWLFPGDYITSETTYCHRCGTFDHNDNECDTYPDCSNCDDRGCEKCGPQPDCYNCSDHGCERCDPQTFPPEDPCNYCNRWFESKLLNEEDLCAQCISDLIEESKRLCVDCDTVYVAVLGDVCAYCQEWRDKDVEHRCCDCKQVHTDPTLSDIDICKDCDIYWTKHYVWWRCALRKFGLLK